MIYDVDGRWIQRFVLTSRQIEKLARLKEKLEESRNRVDQWMPQIEHWLLCPNQHSYFKDPVRKMEQVMLHRREKIESIRPHKLSDVDKKLHVLRLASINDPCDLEFVLLDDSKSEVERRFRGESAGLDVVESLKWWLDNG